MTRRRYLVAYDISEPKRLREVHGCAKRYGYALQYSLFICDLDKMELIQLKWGLSNLISHHEDRVAIIDLGDIGQVQRFEFLGVTPALPTGGPTII